MGDKCECLLVGYCSRRDAHLSSIHWNRCKNGTEKDRIGLDELWAQTKSHSTLPKGDFSSVGKKVSRIGSFLHIIIKRETGVEVPCSSCKLEIDHLNGMTPNEVRSDMARIVDGILDRSRSTAQRWYQKLAVKYVPLLVGKTIQKWVEEACKLEEQTNKG